MVLQSLNVCLIPILNKYNTPLVCTYLQMVGDEIGKIIDSQKQLETKYEDLILKRAELRAGSRKDAGRMKDNDNEIDNVVGGIRQATQTFSKSLKQSPLTADNLVKMQNDR